MYSNFAQGKKRKQANGVRAFWVLFERKHTVRNTAETFQALDSNPITQGNIINKRIHYCTFISLTKRWIKPLPSLGHATVKADTHFAIECNA